MHIIYVLCCRRRITYYRHSGQVAFVFFWGNFKTFHPLKIIKDKSQAWAHIHRIPV